jgi:hypothetical protein
MGTPSFLAYEIKPGKYYSQYMQYDGAPTWKGKEYYETILKSLMEGLDYFIKDNKPNKQFFTRIKHFLNNYQYASSPSFGNNTIFYARDYWDTTVDLWRYLFDKDGNFTFAPPKSSYFCTIPWEFTLNLSKHFAHHDYNKVNGLDNAFKPFWEFMEEWTGLTNPPSVNLTTYQTHAFPYQQEEGWRNAGILTIKGEIRKLLGKENKVKTMFHDKPKKRNKKYTKILYKSEYLDVKRCPLKDLPLLIGTLKREEAIKLFESRLKGQSNATPK